MKRLSRQAGISLVEILVALVISLFLLAGIVQVYTGNRATFAFTNGLAEIQESGRFALDLMSQDLRLSGEWGCIGFDPSDTTNINDTLGGGNVSGYTAWFHDFVNNPPISGSNNTGGLGNSDTLVIRGGKPGQANVEAELASSTFATGAQQYLHTSRITSLEAGDIIVVARCGANDLALPAEADILPVTSVDNTTDPAQTRINLGSVKSQQFENDAMVIELQTVSYFIANNANGQPALFRAEFNAAPQELIEGVDDMQILYGVDNGSDQFPDQYLTANNVADFNTVVAIRIQLLLRSIDDFITDAPQTYTFNGTQVTAADRRIRQVFTTTVTLRNRIGSLL